MGEDKSIALNKGQIVTDERGIPIISDVNTIKNIVSNLKALYPDEKYEIYVMKLKEVV